MRAIVVFPTLAMLAVLTMGSMSIFTVAVVAPVAAIDIGVDATYIGVFTAIVYFFAIVSGVPSGAFITRYGAIRVCQFSMLAAGAGMAVIALASPMAALASAVLLGFAYGPFNPASAHVLADISAARWRPLIFSLKQAGVPLGGALAGAVVPLLVILFGWKGASLTVGIGALIVGSLIQGLRPKFDADRKPDWPLANASVMGPLRLVAANHMLRKYSIAAFIYAGCQVCVGAFFVVYLSQALGMSLVQAGVTFAFVQAGGVFGRVFWGLIAERWISTRVLLAVLGLLIAICLGVTASFTPDWSIFIITVVGFLLGMSSFGWVGIHLSEIARLAPNGKAGDATGGVQVFSFGGVVVVPPCFGVLVNMIDSYTVAFLTIAVLATITGLYLMVSPRETN